MSDSSAFNFSKLVPGFDFLHSLAQGASGALPKMPPAASWVAPTLNIEEVSKRIEELKAVQYWLEQNSRALTATIQALEVQKMTLATLQGMNVQMNDLAQAFQTPAADTSVVGSLFKAAESARSAAQAMAGAATAAPSPASQASTPAAPPAPSAASAPDSKSDESHASTAAKGVDPLQWWGALTTQFQHIATQALQDPATQQALGATTSMATDLAKQALQTATEMACQLASEAGRSTPSTATASGRKKSAASAVSGRSTPRAAAKKTPADPAASAGRAGRKSSAKASTSKPSVRKPTPVASTRRR